MCKTFRPKRNAVIVRERKLHNEELHNLYSSPHRIKIMKPRNMGRPGYVVLMGTKRNA